MAVDDEAALARTRAVARYGDLAQVAAAGGQAMSGEPSVGCFGVAAYDDISGLPDGAVRASLGCGNPLAVADLREGETVLDLGSGGGIDVLLSARRVGPAGHAYGLDMTDEMLALANENKRRAGAENVEVAPYLSTSRTFFALGSSGMRALAESNRPSSVRSGWMSGSGK